MTSHDIKRLVFLELSADQALSVWKKSPENTKRSARGIYLRRCVEHEQELKRHGL